MVTVTSWPVMLPPSDAMLCVFAATVTDCTLMMLSRRLLRRVLEEYPAMAEVMRMALAERLHALSADLSKLHPEFSRK